MQAKVLRNDGGIVTVIVRRGFHEEHILGVHLDLKPGDKVEVKRQVNNPYLVRVKA